jgi:hypothetical protein
VNPWLGWALAGAVVALGYVQYGWQGAVMGITIVVFWLLLQFNRAVRAMRMAAQSPVGHVDSAVMLHARLKPGLRLIDIVPITRSLGRKLGDEPEVFVWTDNSGAAVEVVLEGGRCVRWTLSRPPQP